MAELDLEILYRPGEKNMVTDVLSRYGVDGVVETTASAHFSLGDRIIRRVVYEWMSVVAKHLDFDAFVTAAVEVPRDNYQLPHSLVVSVGPFMVI